MDSKIEYILINQNLNPKNIKDIFAPQSKSGLRNWQMTIPLKTEEQERREKKKHAQNINLPEKERQLKYCP